MTHYFRPSLRIVYAEFVGRSLCQKPPHPLEISMKNRMSTFWTLLLAASLFHSNSAMAGAITYTSQYQGTSLPSTSGGTIADPSWELIANTGSTATSAGGFITGSTVDAADANMQFWMIGDNDGHLSGTNAAWSVNPEKGVTVDFRIQVLSSVAVGEGGTGKAGGFMIVVEDGVRTGEFYFSTDKIFFKGASSYSTSMPLNLTTGFTTFRITMKDGFLSLYLEDMETPLFSELQGGSLVGYNRVLFGDFDSTYSGSFNLEFLKWNNEIAEFSAPVAVPEPAMAMVVLSGVGAVILGRKRFIKK